MPQDFTDVLAQMGPDDYRAIRPDPEGRMVLYRPRVFKVNGVSAPREYHFLIPTTRPPAIHIEGAVLKPGARCLLVLRPDIPFWLEAQEETREYVAIAIDKSYFEQTLRDAFGTCAPETMKTGHRAGATLVSLLQRIETETERGRDANPLMLQCLRTELIIELYRTASGQASRTSANRAVRKAGMAAALAYMETNYAANISLTDISREACMSPYHFTRRFREQMGTTPHRYLLALRLRHAADLLRRNGWTLEEIARQCGFLSLAHFSSAFHRHYGKAPSVWRDMPDMPEHPSGGCTAE